jgi:circadian clock protein KaiB
MAPSDARARVRGSRASRPAEAAPAPRAHRPRRPPASRQGRLPNGGPAGTEAHHRFQLFVAGTEPNSAQAIDNLTRLCDEHLSGHYSIETIDVLTHATAAHAHHVLVTPTLVLLAPLPAVTLYGNLQETGRVMAALRLTRRP